jgi:hypothetical protein
MKEKLEFTASLYIKIFITTVCIVYIPLFIFTLYGEYIWTILATIVLIMFFMGTFDLFYAKVILTDKTLVVRSILKKEVVNTIEVKEIKWEKGAGGTLILNQGNSIKMPSWFNYKMTLELKNKIKALNN